MAVLLLCLGMLAILSIIFVLIVFIRYLKYRETVKLAEQGIARPETPNSKALLHWGVAITFLGLILTIVLYTLGIPAASGYPLQLGPWMLGGLIPLFLGLGLVLLHYLTEKE